MNNKLKIKDHTNLTVYGQLEKMKQAVDIFLTLDKPAEFKGSVEEYAKMILKEKFDKENKNLNIKEKEVEKEKELENEKLPGKEQNKDVINEKDEQKLKDIEAGKANE